ncbi:MAG: YihY/virulence factor BrkB family protein, partial [Pseudomonadota bacterium]
LFEVLQPLGEQGAEIGSQIMSMVNNVSGSVLGGVSLTLFLYTAVSMVQKVETSFNYVWHVHQPRSLSRRILDYATVLLIGPLMMALSLASIASLRNNAIIQSLNQYSWMSALWIQIGNALPFILVTLLFSALYKWMPNTRVKFSAALVGGITAGCLWAITGAYFADFVVYSSRTLVIYASFAIAVTTLLWLYANWLILLLGARLAFYFQNRAYLRIGRHDPALSSATRERLALEIMKRIGTRYVHQSGGMTISEIADALRLPSIVVEDVANQLEVADLIVNAENDTLLPASDIHAMPLTDILSAVRERGDTGLAREPKWSDEIVTLHGELNRTLAASVGDVTLFEFVSRAENATDAPDGSA